MVGGVGVASISEFVFFTILFAANWIATYISSTFYFPMSLFFLFLFFNLPVLTFDAYCTSTIESLNIGTYGQ